MDTLSYFSPECKSSAWARTHFVLSFSLNPQKTHLKITKLIIFSYFSLFFVNFIVSISFIISQNVDFWKMFWQGIFFLYSTPRLFFTNQWGKYIAPLHNQYTKKVRLPCIFKHVKKSQIFNYIRFKEFDHSSGWTLAVRLTHASRTRTTLKYFEGLAWMSTTFFGLSGERESNVLVSPPKSGIAHRKMD